MTSYLFRNLKTRNQKAKELQKQGYIVQCSSIHNQQLHPQYVEDEAEYLRQQTGFGNTVYKTFYPVLYEVKIIK